MSNTQQFEPKGRADHIDHLVSKRLKTRRIILGLSQQELSAAVAVSIQQVQKYEKAVNRISSGKLYSFAKFLKVPISYFFEHDNDPKETTFSEDLDDYAQDDNWTNFPSEKEVLSLVKSFGEIKNAQVRKKIVELMKTVA